MIGLNGDSRLFAAHTGPGNDVAEQDVVRQQHPVIGLLA
jgi:hypothetical protein